MLNTNTNSDFIKPKKVKLADFGMAKDTSVRDVYNVDEEAVMPIPYTSPEGLNGNFSIKNDVYSFGVLLWEIFTWCADPYGTCYFQESNGPHDCPLRSHTLEQIELLVHYTF